MKQDVDSASTYLIEKTIKDTQKYIELQLEYQRIKTSTTVAKTASFAASLLIVGVVLIFAFIFVNIAAAVVLADFLDSPTIGFGVFGAFYAFVTLLVVLFRKKIEGAILNAVASSLLESIEKKDHEN